MSSLFSKDSIWSVRDEFHSPVLSHDHSQTYFKNKHRGLKHGATSTHRVQVPSPPVPENTFIHSKTQQLWPGMTRWEPLDSRARFSILTTGFQSPVHLGKVGS